MFRSEIYPPRGGLKILAQGGAPAGPGFIIDHCPLVPRAHKVKWVGNRPQRFEDWLCEFPVGQAWWLLTVWIGRGFGCVASIGLPIRNHRSLLTSHGRASGLGCASRISSLQPLKASILADLRYRPPFELRATWTRSAAADLSRRSLAELVLHAEETLTYRMSVVATFHSCSTTWNLGTFFRSALSSLNKLSS